MAAPNIYYFAHKETRVVYHSVKIIYAEEEHEKGLTFLGSSTNPNKKMAMALFLKNKLNQKDGWSLKPLSEYPEPEE